MIQDNHIETLISILNECCVDNKIVSRSVLFDKFEELTHSGIEIYRFKKALSFLIKSGKICGFNIKPGRNGGVYKEKKQEMVVISCSYGEFSGYICQQELEKLISSFSTIKESKQNGSSIYRS